MLDQTRDLSGAVTWELTRIYPAPDFVKTATVSDKIGDAEDLPAVAFAGPNRTFPIHTKAATWTSATFLAYNADKVPETALTPIRDNVIKAARLWRISDEIADIFANTKTAQVAGVVHAVEYIEGGTLKKAFPMRNKTEVRAAAEVIQEHRNKMAFDIRRASAARIIEQASRFEVNDLDMEFLSKQAGLGHSSPQRISQQWKKRATFVRPSHPEIADQLDEIATAAMSDTNCANRDARLKMASIMDKLDADHKLIELYGTELESPEDTMFHVTYKQAEAISKDIVPLTNGDTFKKSTLHKISSQDLANWFGDDLVNDVTDELLGHVDIEKLASVVATLPRPDAVRFTKMMEGLAIKPIIYGKQAYVAVAD